jgi:hypothetical protein
MQKFVAEQDLKHLKDLLARTDDAGERDRIARLISEAEGRLAAVEADRKGRKKVPPR